MDLYEKKYKEALERMKSWAKGEHPECFTEAQKAAEFIFPELKESEDEKIRKELISFIRRQIECHDKPNADRDEKFESWIAWLEKLGEQKETLCDECKKAQPSHSCQDITALGRCAVEHEQKPDDKVEPKFHEGEWVVYNNDICQIVKREEGCNKLVTVFGIEKELVNERNLSTARLWTIQNAKDGDVLSDGTTIFIFKDLLSDGSVMSYCDYDADSGESDAFCPLSVNLMCSKITPATKGRHDILFQKMEEAGYEWDAEKKGLKKIEQAYNVEADTQKSVEWEPQTGDTFRKKGTISPIYHLCDKREDGITFGFVENREVGISGGEITIVALRQGYELVERPKSIEDVVEEKLNNALQTKVEQKPEWSEEDEKIYQSIMDDIVQENQLDDKQTDWLTNIKYRNFARPQKQWKPSEEQLKSLQEVIDAGHFTSYPNALETLYEQLKKL